MIMPDRFRNKTISVIGLGYIGLPTAAVFASRQVKVIGVDVNEHAVKTINEGKIHIVEPELDLLVHSTVTGGYLKATNVPEPADAFFIAVPTPFKGDHAPDLSYIEAACKSIAPVLKKDDLVVLESTSPVGTTEQMAQWLAAARPDLTFPQQRGDESDVRIAYCPERVLPGHVIRELVENDRIIGGMTPTCSETAINYYKIFVEGECHITNSKTAEMAKLTENSFRDVNIAFANELSIICDKLRINVRELIGLANKHPRVNILSPGAGVGGHCIAVDPWFIVSSCPEESKIIHTARNVNDYKPQWVLENIKKEISNIRQKNPDRKKCDVKVACLGIAFKPDIDDLRESPAMEIVKTLAETECKILVCEPNIEALPPKLSQFEKVSLMNVESAIARADIICVLVKHTAFMDHVQEIREKKRVIDVVGLTE
jgi:UDP-N-acetyl-D-mannosaminuronic acid dehydrogenase